MSPLVAVFFFLLFLDQKYGVLPKLHYITFTQAWDTERLALCYVRECALATLVLLSIDGNGHGHV